MFRRNAFSLLILITGLLALTGCKGGTPGASGKLASGKTTAKTEKKSATEVAGSPGVVDSVQLCDDYKSGETTADGRFKGKEIQVKGTIRSVRKDNKTNEPMVELKGTTDAKSGSRAVRCYFAAADADAVAKLKKDDEVKVSGTCQGKQGSGDNFNVVMKDCKLLK